MLIFKETYLVTYVYTHIYNLYIHICIYKIDIYLKFHCLLSARHWTKLLSCIIKFNFHSRVRWRLQLSPTFYIWENRGRMKGSCSPVVTQLADGGWIRNQTQVLLTPVPTTCATGSTRLTACLWNHPSVALCRQCLPILSLKHAHLNLWEAASGFYLRRLTFNLA